MSGESKDIVEPWLPWWSERGSGESNQGKSGPISAGSESQNKEGGEA